MEDAGAEFQRFSWPLKAGITMCHDGIEQNMKFDNGGCQVQQALNN